MLEKLKLNAGVVHGDELSKLYRFANQYNFALPAVNVVNSNGINGVLEAASKVNSPVVIQFGQGESRYFAGLGLAKNDTLAAVKGSIVAAHHVHTLAEAYGVPVVLHTDHCNKKLLPWVDGLIEAGEQFFETHGYPLFSSHMLDFSEQPLEENVELGCRYLARIAKLGMGLEVELGVTGGEEDHADNTGVDSSLLYTQPEEVANTFQQLSAISSSFTIAAAFGNVHGVYSPGNVSLEPIILKNAQTLVQRQLGVDGLPVNFVFHGGSGCSREEIRTAIDYGVIKMNINTDLQWAFWQGSQAYLDANHGYLQSQIGNPDGPDQPNKKFYDPRAWLRAGEEQFVKRLEAAFADLNCVDILA